MRIPTIADSTASLRASLPDLVDRSWIDRFVDLQVLAEHGDPDAAVLAEQWMASDPEAHELWTTMIERCRQVRLGDVTG